MTKLDRKKGTKNPLKANLDTIVDPGEHVMAGEIFGGPTCSVNIHRHLKHLDILILDILNDSGS